MPKNLRGGKHKHIKKGSRVEKKEETLPLASDEPGRMYAEVQKKMGTSFEVTCDNGKTERALITGKFRKRVWINVKDIVLIAGELNSYYIIYKYTPDQARQLKFKGLINFDVNGSDDTVIFEGEEHVDSDEDDELFQEFDQAKKSGIQIISNLPKTTKPQKPVPRSYTKRISLSSGDDDESNDSESVTEGANKKTGDGSDKESNDDDEDEKDGEPDDTKNSESNKLANKFKNKSRAGKIVNERHRAAARDKKGRRGGINFDAI